MDGGGYSLTRKWKPRFLHFEIARMSREEKSDLAAVPVVARECDGWRAGL